MWGMQHAVWGMQHVAACHEWHTNVAADSTRLDSTRLDSTLPQTVCHCLWPVDLWHGAHAACCNVACLLPACCLFCLLKCRKCCGSQQAVARGTRAGKQRCNWQLPQMVASNKCCQHVGTHICAPCALLCFCPATRIGIALAFAVWQLLMELLHLPLGLRLLLRVQQSDSCSTTPTACRNNHVQLRSINCLFP